jgi:hypothetical protein
VERIVLEAMAAVIASSGQTRVLSLAAAVAATALAGCVHTSVRVVQKVGVDRPRDRIYVIVYEGPTYPRYARKMSDAVVEALGAHQSARAGKVLSGLEFDTTSVERDVESFGAQLILSIRPIGTRTGRQGEIVALIYGATLTDRPSNQPLWAARIDISGWVDDGIATAAAQIVDALAKDHLIPPAAVSAAAVPRVPSVGSTGSTWPGTLGNP